MSVDQPTEMLGSDLVEFNTHSFVIKVWIEDPSEETTNPVWRGHITHVQSGSRRYLNSLSSAQTFIKPYLKSMGVKIGFFWRLRNQLSRWLQAQNTQRVLRSNINEKRG